MKNNILKVLLMYALLSMISFIVKSSSNHPFKILNLEKGDICKKSQGRGQDYMCVDSKECKSLQQYIQNNNYLDICSFNGREPIVCCPLLNDETSLELIDENPVNDYSQISSIAKTKCEEYKAMDFQKQNYFFIAVVGGIEALSQEFPHMAILGYGATTEDSDDFNCGGSLISERWILTAAHCYKNSKGFLARWVRLGDLNIKTDVDTAQPKDYRIVQHVLHPEYKRTERYNDIALFRVDKNVIFSSFVRPICLNSNPSENPTPQIATGWGRTASTDQTSDILLKVSLDVFPPNKCNNSYFGFDRALKLGILPDSMICAGSYRDDVDTCSGDSGGPLQVKNVDSLSTYTQYGITSFGAGLCGDKDSPGVYTRVSNYIKWIEEIVWPNSYY